MTEVEIELVLAFTHDQVDDIRDQVGALKTAGNEHDARLDALERRLGVTSDPDAFDASRPVSSDGAGSTVTSDWDALVQRARHHAVSRGGDPDTLRIDDLMDAKDVEELRRSSLTTKPLTCRLDVGDLVIATVAGLAAACVDATLVKIPRDMRFHDEPQTGSPLTTRLRSRAIAHDNELADLARVPFDSLNHDQPDLRLAPSTHRADTFGHDPLVGLVFGTIDILRGTSTGIAMNGQMFVRDIADPTTSNPFVAVVLELAHLLSDIGTRSGLPLPGWSLLRLVNTGSIDGQTVSELARQMYLRGYNTWHLPTMATSVAAGELVLRSGWALRSTLDPDWARRRDDEARLAGTTRTGTHPRFLAMALITHGIATAANAGKIAAFGGNPLAFNAPQWARFAQLVTRWWRSQPRSLADVITARSDLNLESLLGGWPTDT